MLSTRNLALLAGAALVSLTLQAQESSIHIVPEKGKAGKTHKYVIQGDAVTLEKGEKGEVLFLSYTPHQVDGLVEESRRMVRVEVKGEDGNVEVMEWSESGEPSGSYYFDCHEEDCSEFHLIGIKSIEDYPCNVLLGLWVSDNDTESEGIYISGIIPGGPAEKAGLEKGDVLLDINGIELGSLSGLGEILSSFGNGVFVDIRYERDGSERIEEVELRPCEREGEDSGDTPEEIEPDAGSDDPPRLNESPQKRLNLPDNTLQLDNLQIFPNPTEGNLRLRFRASNEPILVRVVDLNGREYFRQLIQQFDGLFDRRIDLSKAAPGMLILNISQGKDVYTEPIIRQ
jgi:membrane-associated protease RseP (regulator of RpoE activity)